jgi:hypothetical protein
MERGIFTILHVYGLSFSFFSLVLLSIQAGGVSCDSQAPTFISFCFCEEVWIRWTGNIRKAGVQDSYCIAFNFSFRGTEVR